MFLPLAVLAIINFPVLPSTQFLKNSALLAFFTSPLSVPFSKYCNIIFNTVFLDAAVIPLGFR
jgi:hypothetical protein